MTPGSARSLRFGEHPSQETVTEPRHDLLYPPDIAQISAGSQNEAGSAHARARSTWVTPWAARNPAITIDR